MRENPEADRRGKCVAARCRSGYSLGQDNPGAGLSHHEARSNDREPRKRKEALGYGVPSIRLPEQAVFFCLNSGLSLFYIVFSCII